MALARPVPDTSLEEIAGIAVMPSILDIVRAQTGMRFAAVARVTPERWVACAVLDGLGMGLGPGSELPIDTTLCQDVLKDARTIAFDDALAHPLYCTHRTPRLYGFRSYISSPVFLADGRQFGSLCALDPEPRDASSVRSVAAVEALASLVGRLIDERQRSAATEQALGDERAVGASREQFIAVVAHDLRNPLATIQAAAELMKRDGNERTAGLGTRLRASAVRMARLIDDLVDFARGRSGNAMVAELADHDDVDQQLGAVVDEVRHAHPQREIRAAITLGPAVRCDPARLQQLLSNLVGNAVAYGAPTTPVVVEAFRTGGTARIVVANWGGTISPEQIARLFDPYWRAPDAKPGASMGLGLHICKQIAEAHGGTLSVTSSQEDGTRFQFTWPAG